MYKLIRTKACPSNSVATEGDAAHASRRRLAVPLAVALVATGALQVVTRGPATPIPAGACFVTTGGLCVVPPPVPVDVGSQTSVGDVATFGTTTIAACPQVFAAPGTSTACGSSGSTASLNCSIRVEETPTGGTIYAQSQTTCNETATISYTFGWDTDSPKLTGGPLTISAGQELQVNEQYGGPQSGCHAWAISISASDQNGNNVSPGAGVGYCFG